MKVCTTVLQRIGQGEARATEELFPLVYDELRRLAAGRIAAERSDHTLTATALVHEAYLRLVDVEAAEQWNSRNHFLVAASEAMRRILIESARARKRLKRGGDRRKFSLQDAAEIACCSSPEQILEVDDALTKLEAADPEVARLVRLKIFTGLSIPEAAKAIGMPRSTAYECWDYATAWFAVELG
jgi:RNA polymerase sigma factor (TIGR02999 family)